MKSETLLEICMVLVLLLFVSWLLKSNSSSVESFSQLRPFALCEGDDCYDSIYIDKYRSLHKPKEFSEHFFKFLEGTGTNEDSDVLDIGSGTGEFPERCGEASLKCTGVDKSPHMVEYAKDKVKVAKFLLGDVPSDPMMFDNDRFSHISCSHMTLYEMDDKPKLFRQCYMWLKSGGVLLLHIVDTNKFNKIVPGTSAYGSVNPKGVVNTVLNRSDYSYSNRYEKLLDTVYVQKEEFVDNKTQNVRQYTKKLYMEPKEEIYEMCKNAGFKLLKSENCKTTLQDRNQYFVALQKPMGGEH